MRVVLQRVRSASVDVEGETVAAIDRGLVALVGVGEASTGDDARWLADKTAGLRVFPDGRGSMQRSVEEVGGAVLAVSQVTLYGDASGSGRRPSFDTAAGPQAGRRLYEAYCQALPVPVEQGVFGAHMDIRMLADGPVTIVLERESGRADA